MMVDSDQLLVVSSCCFMVVLSGYRMVAGAHDGRDYKHDNEGKWG